MSGILIVCTGNVCRSPLAEGFLRAALAERWIEDAPVVTSAGTAGWEGAAAMEESIRSARERGVDIGAHVARALRPAMLEEADLIVCMAADHRRSVVRARPDVADKTFTIKELVRLLESASPAGTLAERVAVAAAGRNGTGPGDEDVRDPLGDQIDGYREIADELLELSRRLAVVLTAEPA